MNPLNFRPITYLIKSATFLNRTFLLITRACYLSACCGPPDITGPSLTCVSAAPHDRTKLNFTLLYISFKHFFHLFQRNVQRSNNMIDRYKTTI